MKTVQTTRILSNVQKVRFGYWDEEAEKFIPVDDNSVIAEVASRLKCSAELVEAILLLIENLTSATHSDLSDIWKRLDEK